MVQNFGPSQHVSKIVSVVEIWGCQDGYVAALGGT